MQKESRPKITEINPHFLCVLCGGYFIDATTIVECLHSFCKSCIVRYLETSKYCPICEVMVHKKRPIENIRLDHTLQDIVYKLVPGLFKEEMRRRREYYEKHPVPGLDLNDTENGATNGERVIFSPEEQFSIAIQFCPKGRPMEYDEGTPEEKNKFPDCRYLKCPATVSLRHLKKFIRMKFNLSDRYEIDIFHTTEILKDSYTLMDVAYIYSWRRKAPLQLYYSMFENPAKKMRLTKRFLETKETVSSSPDPAKKNSNKDVFEFQSDSNDNSMEIEGDAPATVSSENNNTPVVVTAKQPSHNHKTEDSVQNSAECNTSISSCDQEKHVSEVSKVDSEDSKEVNNINSVTSVASINGEGDEDMDESGYRSSSDETKETPNNTPINAPETESFQDSDSSEKAIDLSSSGANRHLYASEYSNKRPEVSQKAAESLEKREESQSKGCDVSEKRTDHSPESCEKSPTNKSIDTTARPPVHVSPPTQPDKPVTSPEKQPIQTDKSPKHSEKTPIRPAKSTEFPGTVLEPPNKFLGHPAKFTGHKCVEHVVRSPVKCDRPEYSAKHVERNAIKNKDRVEPGASQSRVNIFDKLANMQAKRLEEAKLNNNTVGPHKLNNCCKDTPHNATVNGYRPPNTETLANGSVKSQSVS